MSASVEYLASGIRGANHGLGQTERIVEAFNPYSTSPNIKLLLDLVAHRFESRYQQENLDGPLWPFLNFCQIYNGLLIGHL